MESDTAHDALDDGAGSLLEGTELVAASSVRNEDSGLGGVNRNVVFETGVGNGQAGVRPLSEKLGLGGEGEFEVCLGYFVRFPCFILSGFINS